MINRRNIRKSIKKIELFVFSTCFYLLLAPAMQVYAGNVSVPSYDTISISKSVFWAIIWVTVFSLVITAGLLMHYMRFKRVDKQLRESEERYRLLLENTPDALMVHSKGRIVFANPSAAEVFGVASSEELIGKPTEEFPHPLHLQESLERVNKVEEGEVPPRREMKIIRGDNEVRDVEVMSVSFPYRGELMVLTSVRDITEQKQLNEAVQLDQLKTEFFANISHELRTPLNGILSAVQLSEMYMKKGFAGNNAARTDIYVKTVKQNAHRLLRLVNNLIDVTEIHAGNLKASMQNTDIVSIVEETALSVADFVRDRGLTFLFDTDVEEKVMACDAEKIERIILNLLSNATKFSKPGGNISVNIYDRGENIAIAVRDTGIGIPRDKKKFIFDRFRQADKSFTRAHEGSGIGLSLVKAFVEMHNGDISLRSEYGQGSEFVVTLPVRLLPEDCNKAARDRAAVYADMKERRAEKVSVEFSDIYDFKDSA